MGCCYSRIEREELVSRCKARKRYMKQLVKARQAVSASHAMYLRSLRTTGSALLQFSNTETTLHLQHNHRLPPILPSPPPPLPPTPPPPPPPPMSPSSDTTWTSITASPALPPPPPPQSSSWDFWDPFMPPPPSTDRSVTEEEWEEVTTSTATMSEMAVTATGTASITTAPPSMVSGFSKETSTASGSGSELAMVVSRNSKDLLEIVKEVDEYFLRAADAGSQLSLLLEVPNPSLSSQTKGGKVYNYGCNLTSPSTWAWCSSPKMDGFGFGKLGEEMVGMETGGGIGHCCTLERLYAWEKKLFHEVKTAQSLKIEHEKKVALLRKLEMKRGDYLKTEKTNKEVEKLEAQMMVASQGIESTSAEIIKLRETQLYPQLLELLKGYMNTVDSKKVELLDMGSGVSETTAEENVQKASAMPKQELVNAGMETMDEKNQVIKCSKTVAEQTAEVGTQSAVTSKDQGYHWGHQHQPIHLSVNASVMKHSECSECHSEEPWLLHNVRHKASYQRYCTHCLLKNFPGFFCPFCFHVYEESPQPKDRLMCIKCTSISHLSCVPSPHPPSFLCPACSSPILSFFNPTPSAASGRTIDKDSARALLAAAKIAAASMTKAAGLAKVESEKRVKDAAVAKKHAREALERLTYLAAKEKETATDRFNLKKLNANSNSASALTRGAEKPSNGVYSIPVPPTVNANANANAGEQAQQSKQSIPSVPIDK